MLRSGGHACALAALAALVLAGCGSSRAAPKEANFRYAAAGLVPVAPAHTLNAPKTPTTPRGTSQVAYAVGRAVSVYRSRRDPRPERRFPALNPFKVRQVFLVKRAVPGWLEVYLPVRPNDATAWVRASSVGVTLDPYRVVVDTARHELTILRAGRVAMRAPAGIGKVATPTPHGLFYVLEKLRMVPATGPYGTYALGLSAYSNVLKTFGTGDAQVALHGTNEPWTVGQSTSNGCVHLSDRVATWLARTLPLGTPVEII
jgi:lipoprotein-anchoring transpeptidase ErfK/SrfK